MLRKGALVLLLAGLAHADGKMFAPMVPVVETPDQRAILYFMDGFERLVVETAYRDAGQDEYAWVVPLPSAPKVAPVSPDVFRTIEIVYAPSVIAHTSSVWMFAVYLLVVIPLNALLRGQSIWVRAPFAILAVLGVLYSCSSLMPSSGMPASVTVLCRENVGSYDVATLSAVEPGALLEWLDKNGFEVAPESRSVIGDYVREGWVFAVARLKPDEKAGRRKAHPLSFEFETKRPVYPLRLTGVGNGDCDIDLYVYSNRRASSERLPAVSCREIDEVGHNGLRKLVSGATVMTRLSGTLRPEDMRQDLFMEWEEFSPLAEVLYTARAATNSAATRGLYGAVIVLLGLSLVAGMARVRSSFRKDRGRDPTLSELARKPLTVARKHVVPIWVASILVGAVVGVLLLELGRSSRGSGRRAQGGDVFYPHEPRRGVPHRSPHRPRRREKTHRGRVDGKDQSVHGRGSS